MISGLTAAKSFQIWCHFPCPALAALHAQPIIRYFAVPFGRPFSFAYAIHMYTLVSGKAQSVPLHASPCSPWDPRVLFGLDGAVLVLVSACLPCAVSCLVSREMWLVCHFRSAELGG